MKRVVKKRVSKLAKRVGHVSHSREKAPLGVRIISVLYYIGAALSWVSALMFLVVGVLVLINPQITARFQNLMTDLSTTFGLSSMIGPFLLIFGIILIAVGVLDFFIARGLVRKIRWTRILVIALSVVGFLSSLISLIGGDFGQVFGLVISGVIGWYLWFSKQAKNFYE
jgi:hypothetical protein